MIDGRKMVFLQEILLRRAAVVRREEAHFRELPLRGAAWLMGERWRFWMGSRCAGLVLVVGGRRLEFWGSYIFRCAGLHG